MFDFDTSTGEIFLYDFIGPEWWGMIGAESIKTALDEIPGRVTLRINSGGGSVDQAIAMYGLLERHRGGVDVVIDSAAYSAASFLAMVGEKITIAEGGAMMLHSPLFMFAGGNAKELRKLADELDVHQERVVGYYARRMGIEREEVAAILEAETWYGADGAIEAKLADEIGNPAIEPATVPAGMFKNTPPNLVKDVKAGDRTPYPYARERAKIQARRNRFA